MRVLVTGATGFIGRHVAGALLSAGHAVVGAARDVSQLDRRFPGIAVLAVDMNADTAAATWVPRLSGIDAVVNCAGILQESRGQSMEAVHFLGPKALFDACAACGVRRVVQISAVSADEAAGTGYARSKRKAEEYLARLDLDWVVLRPSLVYGDGSYGGTSLLRALAAMPLTTPVVGRGEQPFQPIHMDDLTAMIVRLLETGRPRRVTLSPAGPEVLTLREIVRRLRAWLGLPEAPALHVPLPLVRVAARVADWMGAGPIGSTALRQLEYGNAAPPEAGVAVAGVSPRTMRAALTARPSHTQDRWHARLYVLRPALRWTLGLAWSLSGLIGLIAPAASTYPLAEALGVSASAAPVVVTGACTADIALGLCLLLRVRPGWLAAAQIVLIAGYTLGLTLARPELWADPLGPLLKNVPLVAAVLVLAAIENER